MLRLQNTTVLGLYVFLLSAPAGGSTVQSGLVNLADHLQSFIRIARSLKDLPALPVTKHSFRASVFPVPPTEFETALAKAKQDRATAYAGLVALLPKLKQAQHSVTADTKKLKSLTIENLDPRTIKREIAQWSARLKSDESLSDSLSSRQAGLQTALDQADSTLLKAKRALDQWQSRHPKSPLSGLLHEEQTIIVTFHESASPSDVAATLNDLDLTPEALIQGTSTYVVTFATLSVEGNELATLETLLGKLKSNSLVVAATPNFPLFEAQAAVSVCNPETAWRWFDPKAAHCAQQIVAMHFPSAWNLAARIAASPISVAIIDSGFPAGNDQSSAAIDGCAQGRGTGSHGCEVLSVLAATLRGPVQYSTCSLEEERKDPETWSCPYGPAYGYAQVLAYLKTVLATGAKVVNISLAYNFGDECGGQRPSDSTLNLVLSEQSQIALNVIGNAEALLVVPAGNDNDTASGFQAAFSNPFAYLRLSRRMSPPKAAIIVVGAQDDQFNTATFSNAGAQVYAIGVNVPVYDNSRQSLLADGTSFAAPFVSLAAALIYSVSPKLPASSVADAILSSSGPHGTLDALGALLTSLPRQEAFRALADLNHDGKVDQADVDLFLKRVALASSERFAIEDLNGDGIVSVDPNLRSRILGEDLSDSDIFLRAWSEGSMPPGFVLEKTPMGPVLPDPQ